MPCSHSTLAKLKMTKVSVSSLKQCPYGFATSGRVDPTREDVQAAIEEERFCEKVMDRDYEEIKSEILNRTKNPEEMDQMMRTFHAERIAELVRTKDSWLGVPDEWPIRINQFSHVTAGNHRFRAIRYLNIKEIDVLVENVDEANGMYNLEEIW